ELAAAIGPVAWTHAVPPPIRPRDSCTTLCPPRGVRGAARSGSWPTAHSNEPALVAVTGTWGAPLAALATAVAPTAAAAPLKAATVMQPFWPLLASVATTEAPVSGAVAYACQTSAVPATVLALAAGLQLRPPPDTETTDWLPGASADTKA